MIRIGNRATLTTTSAISGQGFIDYNDAATSTTPISLPADTWTTLTNDGLGAFTNDTYAPAGVTSLMNTPAGTVDLSQLSLGDSVIIRNDFTVTPSTNNQILMFRYILGTGASEYTLEKLLGKMDTGGGIPVRFALRADYIYLGDSNTKDNPVTLQVKLSGTGSVVNAGTVIQAIKQ